MKIKLKYDVISPDGFSIHISDTYSSRKKAKKALMEWVKQYQWQGYYSTSNRERISLDELPFHCKIQVIK